MNDVIFQYNVISKYTNDRGPIEGRKRSEVLEECADISFNSFSRYANYIGVDHLVQTTPIYTNKVDHPYSVFFEVLRLIYDKTFDQYDRVLFVDSDIYCNTQKNIFELFEPDADVMGVLESDIVTQSGGGYNPWDFKGSQLKKIRDKYDRFNIPIVPTFYPNRKSRVTVMNTGVMVWSRDARNAAARLFDDWEEWIEDDDPMWLGVDQVFISGQLMKYDFNVQTIDQTWNETPSGFIDESWKDSKFIHYTGGQGKLDMIRDYHNGKFKV